MYVHFERKWETHFWLREKEWSVIYLKNKDKCWVFTWVAYQWFGGQVSKEEIHSFLQQSETLTFNEESDGDWSIFNNSSTFLSARTELSRKKPEPFFSSQKNGTKPLTFDEENDSYWSTFNNSSIL